VAPPLGAASFRASVADLVGGSFLKEGGGDGKKKRVKWHAFEGIKIIRQKKSAGYQKLFAKFEEVLGDAMINF